MDRDAQLKPLGLQRLRILECLGGNMPGLEGYFKPSSDTDIFTAFHVYVKELSILWAKQSDSMLLALLAAARFLCGEVEAAEDILTQLPSQPISLDHGAGYCRVAPFHALSAALPLPQNLANTQHWLQGSEIAVALCEWLDAHRDRLQWDERSGIYTLV